MNKKLTKHSNSTGGYYETTDDYNEGYTPRDYSEYTPVTKNKSSYVSTYGGYS